MDIIKDQDSYVGYKVRLFPTKSQEKIFYEYFGMNRFVYNFCIDIQEEHHQNYKQGKEKYKYLSEYSLRNMIIKMKNTIKEYKWLDNYNNESIRGTVADLINAYKRYDNDKLSNKKPRYKNRFSKKQFLIRYDRMSIDEKYIKVPSIGKVKYYNSYDDSIIGDGNKEKINSKYIHYSNPRISFDGNYFYLSFTIPKDQDHNINSYQYYYENKEWQEQESSEAIGIDVGLRNEKWFVDSIGNRIERPDSTVLNKKINRLQRKLSRQRNINRKKNSLFDKQHPNGSKNMQKTKAKINKYFKKINNIRRNVVHEYSCSLLKMKPKAIVMENISINSMIINDNYVNYKNKINAMIKDAALYESMQIIEKKMINNGIPVIRAASDYPSSQLCSCCGYRQDIGRRKIYRCPICGNIINRDLNAAINLAKLAY